MFDWLSPWVFLQTMARVAVVWLAFFGAGRILRKPLCIDRAFPLLPSEIVGLLAFVLLTIPLSLLGVMNRMVCPVILVIMAIPGALFTYASIRDNLPIKKPAGLHVALIAFLFVVLTLNFTQASMPEIRFDDPLITYAVQPDRWLNNGRIYWLDETVFSGFPMLYEMTAVWPASISSDRMNQLSVLQVFQMSMLLIAVLRGLSVLKIRKNLWIPVVSIVLLTTSLYMICSMAKTDTMCIMFCTIALSCAIRQKEQGFQGSPLSSWLLMGLGLATKQTSIIVLIPFSIYSFRSFFIYNMRLKVLALLALLLVPGAYGVRTMLMTGSPTYPVFPVNSLLRDGWQIRDPEENASLLDRASYLYEHKKFPLLKHLGIFFAYMEGNILLLLFGVGISLLARRWKDALLAVPILLYCFVAIVAFWPPWWGAKYSIVIFPFIAILGTKLLQHTRAGYATVLSSLVLAFVIPGFVAVAVEDRPFNYRAHVASAVLCGRWNPESRFGLLLSTPEGMTHMWANSAFPHETVIFSILEEKRYFFDGTVIVGWRHPVGQQLYLDNTLEEELAILDSLRVDFVGLYRENPAILNQEDRLAIMDHIGMGDILEPVIIIDEGYLLCRYNRSLTLP